MACAWSCGEGELGGGDKLPSNYTPRPFQGRSSHFQAVNQVLFGMVVFLGDRIVKADLYFHVGRTQ